MGIELKQLGLVVQCKLPLQVKYLEHVVGAFEPDVLVNGRLILELKSVSGLAKAHEAQLVNYLVATGIDDGLLINFGLEKVEIRRKFRLYRKPSR